MLVFEQSKVLSIIRMVSSPVSLLASIAIIVIICRSSEKFTTTQNRLLLGLCISDILSSTATAFATTAMPKDTPDVWMAQGTVTTCEIQGFFVLLGGIITPCYNAGLCIYFLLRIRYDVNDEIIKRRVEPFLHIIPIVYAISVSAYCFSHNYFNPGLGVCSINHYPSDCSNEEGSDIPCERGGDDMFTKDYGMLIYGCLSFILVPVTIFTSMGLLITSVWKQEAAIKKYGIGSLGTSHEIIPNNQGRPGQQDENESNRSCCTRRRNNLPPPATSSEQLPEHVKKVLYKGIAYASSWLITFIFPLTLLFVEVTNGSPSFELRVLVATFYPLQGFFNFLVFMFPKVRNVYQAEPTRIPFWLAVWKAMRGDFANMTMRERRRRSIVLAAEIQNNNV